MSPRDADPDRPSHSLRRGALTAILLVAGGVALWAVLWTVERPHAGYDTLWYSMYAYQDAGAPVPESWQRSWDLVQREADPDLLALLRRAPSGAWWSGWDDPSRARWPGIYRERPLMPLIGALAVPILGTDAPLVPSVVAVVLLVLVAGLVLAPLAGWTVTAAFLLLTAANPFVARWLIYLTTDSLALALWFAVMALAARYAVDGRTRCAVGVTFAALALAFTRPSATAVPLAMAACAGLALLTGYPVWRRFAVTAGLTLLPVAIFVAYVAVAGLPSFADQLQDIPTVHFSRPDVANPLAAVLARDLSVGRILLRSLPGQPLVWLSLLGAVAGFLVARRWWTAPFMAAAATVPLLLAVHPVLTEADRTLAPIWLSLNLGLALLVSAAAARFRERRSPASSTATA
ncbi:MAG TPA: hypothetical protein VKU35_01135 [Candidatus Limnocylindria bacterium]|nr:hypothetical protein [Candidatus Limnocylindria bacterium]